MTGTNESKPEGECGEGFEKELLRWHIKPRPAGTRPARFSYVWRCRLMENDSRTGVCQRMLNRCTQWSIAPYAAWLATLIPLPATGIQPAHVRVARDPFQPKDLGRLDSSW